MRLPEPESLRLSQHNVELTEGLSLRCVWPNGQTSSIIEEDQTTDTETTFQLQVLGHVRWTAPTQTPTD